MELDINKEQGFIDSIEKYFNRELLVPRAGKSDKDLKAWWNDRAIPKIRLGFKELCSELGVASSGEYLVQNLGLSLNDCYWIRPKDVDLKWADVNLFDNIDKSPRTPNSSTGGDLPKWWVNKNGAYYLIERK